MDIGVPSELNTHGHPLTVSTLIELWVLALSTTLEEKASLTKAESSANLWT